MQKPIEGCDGYFVTRRGAVISTKRRHPRTLKTAESNCGYEIVTLVTDRGSRKTFYVHRLVAAAYLGGVPAGKVVNHKDGDKFNNTVDNLEVVTYSENNLHAHATGLKPNMIGEKNGGSKLSEAQALALILEIIDGARNKDLGKKYGLHPQYISLIRHKRRWAHIWQDVERATTIETAA
ncbi:HNH endonuclease signature motif containing protein [Paenibacillus polysaccharolyticus]|uniref:HNH endonuclease signature motif containing protein n=1 Tax=Paenibacillus polysaccharolyticus TaxID=582692 RepID=UPI003007FA44